jgi:putative ABC transport system permease protein
MFEDDSQMNGMETILDPQFLEANHLTAGDKLVVAVNGKEVPLTVRGSATTPEFSYPVKNITTMLNDPVSFGIAIMPQYQAQKLLNMGGQINSIIIRISPGSNERYIKEEINHLKTLRLSGGLSEKRPKQQFFSQGPAAAIASRDPGDTNHILLAAIAIQFVMLGRMIKPSGCRSVS